MPVFPFLVSVRSGLLAGLEFRAISEISGSGLFRSGPPRCGCDRTAIRPFSAIGQKVLVSECASCTGLVLGERMHSYMYVHMIYIYIYIIE